MMLLMWSDWWQDCAITDMGGAAEGSPMAASQLELQSGPE